MTYLKVNILNFMVIRIIDASTINNDKTASHILSLTSLIKERTEKLTKAADNDVWI